MKKYILPALLLAAFSSAVAQENYNLVIEANDGVKTKISTSEIEGVLFSDMPDYTPADNLLSAVYSTSGSLGQYVMEFCTGKLDSNGNPVEVGGARVSLTLYGPESESSTSAELPAGYYVAGVNKSFTFSPSQTAVWVRYDEGDDKVSVAPVISGSVDVRRHGEAYEIRMELGSLSGEIVNLSYEGKIIFTAGNSEYERFEEPVDVTLSGLQGRFYANWYYPFSDDMLVQGYSGEFDENDVQISGYWLNLPVYMPKVDNPMAPEQKFADGVYSIEHRSNPVGNTYLPFTFQEGTIIDFMGTPYSSGTYLTYKSADGKVKIAYIKEGTVTVSDNGTKMKLDGKDEYGTSIVITFSGKPLIVNYCDNDEKEIKHPWSTLKGNHELKFTANTVGVYFKDEPSIVENLNTYTLWIVDNSMTKGEYLQFVILTDANGISDGTYNVNETFKSGTMLHGWTGFSGTDMGGSWYADLDSSNEMGEQQSIAPIYGGSMTVSSTGNGMRKIVFNLIDDNGNKITGEYSGLIIDGDENLSSTPKPRKMRLRK